MIHIYALKHLLITVNYSPFLVTNEFQKDSVISSMAAVSLKSSARLEQGHYKRCRDAMKLNLLHCYLSTMSMCYNLLLDLVSENGKVLSALSG